MVKIFSFFLIFSWQWARGLHTLDISQLQGALLPLGIFRIVIESWCMQENCCTCGHDLMKYNHIFLLSLVFCVCHCMSQQLKFFKKDIDQSAPKQLKEFEPLLNKLKMKDKDK